MERMEIIRELIRILDCYEAECELLESQGRSFDGYSAFYNFLDLAKRVKDSQG